MPLIGVQDSSIRGWNSVVKRLMDVSIAAVVLVFGAIPMALIALAIKLDSRGPVMWRQRRVGRAGQDSPWSSSGRWSRTPPIGVPR